MLNPKGTLWEVHPEGEGPVLEGNTPFKGMVPLTWHSQKPNESMENRSVVPGVRMGSKT